MAALAESSLHALVDLFHRMADAHTQLAGSFVYGDEKDLRAWAAGDEPAYPVLFLEMPDEAFDGRCVHSVYEFGFAVFYNVGRLDASTETFGARPTIDAWAVSQDISRDLLAMIAKMDAGGQLSFDVTSSKLTPTTYSPTVDRCVGYRCEIKISYPAPLCVDMAKWTRLPY